ncbi:MAG: AAA family ATPase [Chloroflexi bacterium]|nr:AAA family ATPase [Chloroflexota bacterium]
MKLSKIEITYFRCFQSLAIDLQPDINVIVGANGAGKSSILDAIAIALYEVVAANGAGGKRQRATQGAALEPTDIYIDPQATGPMEGRQSFVQVRATAMDFYEVSEFRETLLTDQPVTLEWSEHIRFTQPNTFSYDTRASEQLSRLHRYFQAIWDEIGKSTPQALIPLPVVAYYRATRRILGMPNLGDIFKVDLSRTEAFANALNAGADFTAMCQWLYLRENEEIRAQVSRGQSDPDASSSLRAFREALRNTIEGVKRIYFDGRPPRLMIDLQNSEGSSQALELAQLSDGYRNLLALVLDFARRLAQANPNWPDPLKAPGILLIDEIELHLHPRWQQNVVPSLQSIFPNTQLVVSTHSPAILTTVRREHIHLLGSDHKFEYLPTDVGTYGAENSRVLAEVFGTHARPQNVETVGMLQTYLGLVEKQKHDTEEARSLRRNLENDLGESDPDLRRADLRIRQLVALGKKYEDD